MVTLRHGPAIYFGADSQLVEKWRAGDAPRWPIPTSAGADYIDVTDPGRPAAGTGSDGASSPSRASTSGSATDRPPRSQPADQFGRTP